MSNKLKIKGAKPLLSLTANNEFAILEVSNPIKAFELLYETLCDQKTQATMCIMMAVECLRQCNPDIYQDYQEHIARALLAGGANVNIN